LLHATFPLNPRIGNPLIYVVRRQVAFELLANAAVGVRVPDDISERSLQESRRYVIKILRRMTQL